MMGAINEYDRAMIVARMKAGRIAKARKGEHAAGRIPLGYTSVTVDGRKTLVKNNAEAEIVRLVFNLRAERNLSYQKIADYLNENGYKPKNWTAEAPTKFHKSTVQKILNNTKYSGTVTLNEHGETVAEGKNDSLRLL
jgi:DNA invertase Pin-like site-specific DNA recombinase